MLHDEVHYIAALATGKAFAQSLGWRYVERRGLIVVERAQTYIVPPRFRSVTKSDTTSTICAASRNSVYGGLVYHDSSTKLHIKSASAKKIGVSD